MRRFNNNTVRLPEFYVDAKELLTLSLGDGSIRLSEYGNTLSKLAKLKSYNIAEVENEESCVNISLNLVTEEKVIDSSDNFLDTTVTRELLLLNTSADVNWTYRMINKIWEGEYISTVAIDKNTGVIYFVKIKNTGFELVTFSRVSDVELSIILDSIDECKSYKVGIDEEAMFRYIDGGQGLDHLADNIFVEFNCDVPIRVKM